MANYLSNNNAGLLNGPDVPFGPNESTGLLAGNANRRPDTFYSAMRQFIPPGVRNIIPSWDALGKGYKDWFSYQGAMEGVHDLSRMATTDLFDQRTPIPRRLSNAVIGAGMLPLAMLTAHPALPNVGNISKALRARPDANPAAVRAEVKQQQQNALTEKELEKLQKLQRDHPEFSRASRFMLPGELRPMLANTSSFNKMNQLLEVLPTAKNYAATAKMGAPKKGWYEASTKALIDVFGLEDAPRFASLLASTSPQTSVEMNLLNSLNIWRNWNAAGRPRDAAKIRQIMGDSVPGTKGEESVLEAWAQNTVRALSADNPASVVLSGPKVDSFYQNLVGDVWRVTNDAHMANISGIRQDLLRVSPTEAQLLARNPGYSPAYAAMAARVREGGAEAGMLPAEAQETIWSVALPLMRAQDGGIRAREVLEAGKLTPEMIRGTPDFSTLLNQGANRQILEAAGYGDELAKLQPHKWSTDVPNLSTAEQNELMAAAKRLEDLYALRRRETGARVGHTPGKGYVYATGEAVPGQDMGMFPELAGEPSGKRAAYTSKVSSALTDQQGLDILHKNLGLDPIRTRPMQGAWRMDAEHPIEFNRGFAAGVEVKPVGRPGRERLSKADEQKLRTAATIRGAMTAQHGSPYSGLLADKAGVDLMVPRSNKVSESEIKAFADKYGLEDQVVSDTGQGVNLLHWSDQPYTPEEQIDIGGLLGSGKKGKKPPEPIIARKFTDPENTNVDYVDLKKEWLQPPGTRAVTERMFNELDKLPASAFKRLDGKEIRQTAGDLAKLYRNRAKRTGDVVREDLLNMLDIVRDKGLAGLRLALDNKEVLPALGAIGLLPTLHRMQQQEAGT